MGKRTPLYDEHQAAGAKLVDFAGWEMPLHYGSQLEEHHKVRQDAGMFDVSHMAVIDVKGKKTKDYLRYLLANDVARLQPGKALYTCMLNENGGVIDDLIVYYCSDDFYRLVVNAGTRDKDLAWMRKQSQTFDIDIQERTDLAMIAVQGPQARSKVAQLFENGMQEIVSQLKAFHYTTDKEWFIACTGYTGEDGFEIILPSNEAVKFWRVLQKIGVSPCGLGARDTLRLEAGLNLYGADMDEGTTPLESNLAWTVAFDPKERDFIGRNALDQQQTNGIMRQLVGLILEDKGVLRNHQKVILEGIGEGEITSGGFAPTLNGAIALARVPVNTSTYCQVVVRDKLLKARLVKPPFVRKGKKVYT